MARVIRFHQTGGPEVLRLEQLDVPPPAAGDVRLDVRAIGLNRAEAMFRAGLYLDQAELPSRLGYEAAGVIDAVGAGVEGFAIGDRVATIPGFSMSRYGTYGDQALIPAAMVVQTPDSLSDVQAAAVWMQYMTAYGGLIDVAHLAAGDTVIIPAASSSVGLAAIQIANAVGAVPIATTRTSEKRAALLELGARHVIATAEQDLVAEVTRITEGRCARVIFDPVGGPGIKALARAAAPGAMIVLYGALAPEPTPFPLMVALGKGLCLRGFVLFEVVSDPARLARGKAYVLDGLASGALQPVIARTFPLEQMVEAHRFLESNQQIGKIVVTTGL